MSYTNTHLFHFLAIFKLPDTKGYTVRQKYGVSFTVIAMLVRRDPWRSASPTSCSPQMIDNMRAKSATALFN